MRFDIEEQLLDVNHTNVTEEGDFNKDESIKLNGNIGEVCKIW